MSARGSDRRRSACRVISRMVSSSCELGTGRPRGWVCQLPRKRYRPSLASQTRRMRAAVVSRSGTNVRGRCLALGPGPKAHATTTARSPSYPNSAPPVSRKRRLAASACMTLCARSSSQTVDGSATARAARMVLQGVGAPTRGTAEVDDCPVVFQGRVAGEVGRLHCYTSSGRCEFGRLEAGA